MGLYSFKLPDVGEGVVEAEIVEWHITPGQNVKEDDVLVDLMTDKATVEIPSPVSGVIKELTGDPGDVLPVGTVIITIETDSVGETEEEAPKPESAPAPEPASAPEPAAAKAEASNTPVEEPKPVPKPAPVAPSAKAAAPKPTNDGERPLASPAVRKRALEQDIDLGAIPGSGPAGRISHQDVDDFIAAGGRLMAGSNPGAREKRTGTHEQKIIGLRRKIAQNLAHSKRTIPHFAYVEEVEMDALEQLRVHLNANKSDDQPKLTVLPFLLAALIKALPDFEQVNATYDDDTGIVTRHDGVHAGIATATPNGLMVPVVHHAETMDIWECAAQIKHVTEATRNGTATRDELTGSTITITSLGALGGIASTPVINAPEVAIIGVNKLQVRPVWRDGAFQPRKMMNLSSSFDHRIVDGYDAARLIQRIKQLLEYPATLFM